VEEGAGRQEPISLSESGQIEQADCFGEEGMENGGWVAPDAVVQRAMRHSSPETNRRYQLGMVKHLRQNLEKANEGVQSAGLLPRGHSC
jgi:hypothetical protein